MSNRHPKPADAVDSPAATQPMRAAHGSLILPGNVDPDIARAVIDASDAIDAGPVASLPPGATDVEGGLRITIQRRDEEIERLLDDNRQMVDELNRFHEARRESIGSPERPRRALDPIAQLLHGTALALQTTALVDLHREHCGKPGYKGRYLDAATKVGDALCAEIGRG